MTMRVTGMNVEPQPDLRSAAQVGLLLRRTRCQQSNNEVETPYNETPHLSSAARPRSASRSAACASIVTRSISSFSRATPPIAPRSASHLSASSCRP